MNLLGMLLDQQGSPALQQITRTFGVSEGDARNALSALVPALARGMQNNMARQNGLQDLLGALAKGGHQRYLDQAMPREEVTTDGNAILGHLFGSKDISRRVASHAAAQTGLDSGLLKKMLPVIAALVMGSVSRQTGAGQGIPGLPGGAAAGSGLPGMPGSAAGGGLGDLLTRFLDADKDGSVLDDLMGMAGKLF